MNVVFGHISRLHRGGEGYHQGHRCDTSTIQRGGIPQVILVIRSAYHDTAFRGRLPLMASVEMLEWLSSCACIDTLVLIVERWLLRVTAEPPEIRCWWADTSPINVSYLPASFPYVRAPRYVGVVPWRTERYRSSLASYCTVMTCRGRRVQYREVSRCTDAVERRMDKHYVCTSSRPQESEVTHGIYALRSMARYRAVNHRARPRLQMVS